MITYKITEPTIRVNHQWANERVELEPVWSQLSKMSKSDDGVDASGVALSDSRASVCYASA